MRQRATRMSSNAHGPLRTVAALVAAMFAATSAPAFIYDANDLSTQYQDSVGTLPVTAVEQPVGLILDKSKGAVRGAENVTNPGAPFTAATGWVTNGTLSVVGGKLRCTATATGAFRATFAPTSIAGRTYEVKIAVAASTVATQTGAWQFSTATGVYATTTASTAARTSRFIITPPSSPFYIGVTATAANIGDYFEIELASSREIPGNHLIQPTSASRPTLTARTNQVLNSSFSGGGSIPTSWSATLGTTTSAVQGTVDGNAVYRQTCTVNTDRPFFSQSVALQASLTYVYTARIDNVYSGAPTISNTIGVVNLPTGASASYRLNGSPVASNTPISSGDLVGLVIGVSTTAGTAILRLGIGTTSGTLADIAFSRPSLEFGDTPSRFQRNTSATDYDTAGFAKGWRFDGVDDGMYTAAALDLTSTNKLSITMGVLATNSSGTQILMETGASYGVGTGRFEISLNEVFAGAYTFARRAPTPNNTYQTELAAAAVPRRNIYSALSNGDSTIGISTRVDGVPSTRGISNPDTTPAHSSDVLYFGRRNNASNPFQGVIYSARLIGRRISPDELGWLEAQAKLDMSNNL